MGTMIRQVFYIPQYKWTVTVYYAVTGYDVERIMRGLRQIGCGEGDLRRAYHNIASGAVDTGLTYSNAELRQTIMLIGRTTTAEQFQNSLDHEKGHLCRHISQAMHIDPYGEEAEYLAGYVGQRIFEVARMFPCDTCRRKHLRRVEHET